jgi:hypothetical protein
MNFYVNTRTLFPNLNITFFYQNSVRKFSFPIARGNWKIHNNPKIFSSRIVNSKDYLNDYKRITNITTNNDKLEEIFFCSDSFSRPFNMSLRIDKNFKRSLRMYKEFDSNTDSLTLLKLY